MSSVHPIETTEDPQPGADHTAETTGLAETVMSRARWMQRVLSPWTQRWLSAEAMRETTDRTRSQQPFASLTGANAERTLARVHVQYESHTNLEMPTTGTSLPLAGAVDKPAPAVGAAEPVAPAAPAASRRAQGPYSKPFNSLEDFVQAVAAAKERAYAPPPPAEEQPPPAPKRPAGPYSRPFQSMEEFVQAVNAAHERDYAPPPPAEITPPAPPREMGPYSHAFRSFEDFVKAVGESRNQGETTGAEESPPRESAPSEPQPSAPTARVRPMSRIEELPTRGEARPAASPIDLPVPSPEISRPVPPAQPAVQAQSAVKPVAAPPPVAPQPAAVPSSAVMQRSPLASSPESSLPEEEAESTMQRSVTSTLQQAETPTRSEPAAPSANDVAVPAATLSPELPVVAQPLDMPLVQRHTAESESSVEAPVDMVASIETEQPIVQRQAADVSTPAAVKSASPAAPSVEPAAHADKRVAQRQAAVPPQSMPSHAASSESALSLDRAAEPIAPQSTEPVPPDFVAPFMRPDMPLVLRQSIDEVPEVEEVEDQSAETVQRHMAEVPPQPTPDQVAPQLDAEPSAQASQPIVQRQTSDSSAPPAPRRTTSPTVQPPSDQAAKEIVQRQVSDTPVQHSPTRTTPLAVEPSSDRAAESIEPQQAAGPVQPESTASPFARPDMPLVQRQSADEVIEPEKPADQTAPVMQRQIEETEPVTPETPEVVQRQSVQPPTSVTPPRRESALPQIDQALPSTAEQAPTQSAEMPLVQRQPATFEAAPSSESTAEASSAMPEVRRSPVVPPEAQSSAETRPASVDMPLVQRQPSDNPTSVPPVVQRETAAPPEAVEEIDETAAPVQRRADVSAPEPTASVTPAVPLEPSVQRQPAEAKPAPPAKAVPVSPAVQPVEKIVAPLTDSTPPASRVDMPLVQRQSAEPADDVTALPAEASALEDDVSAGAVQRKALPIETPPSPATQPIAPIVQRQAVEALDVITPSQPSSGEVTVTPPSSADAHGPLDMPLAQRQSESQTSAQTIVPRSALPDEADAVLPQPNFDLSERILSRVAPPERRAAAKPVDLPLHRVPLQPESQPAAQTASHPTVGEGGYATSGSSPFAGNAAPSVAPTIQRMPEPVIQRTPIESTTSTADIGFIQREETVPATTAPESEMAVAPVDLDQLARQVYPIIKRLIAIERERRAFR